jgi:DNA-binding response OmpR family regulator
VESVIVTLQDMTPLEELERLRAEFLAMISHELRAPLASIKGSAATLTGSAETLDPAEMLLFFRIIEQQADQMSALITDLLDMARIETGALPVSAEPADPAILVDQARNTFLSGGPGNPVHIDLEPDLPRVLADRRRIVQVLVNLLYNSSRNSPESAGIRVGAMREADYVAFSVADDGRGLSPELIPYLFRKFARFEGDDPEHGAGGSGLGLAICRGIVEAHGGRIRAESAGMGLGARFTFTLPVADGPVGIPRTGSAWTLSPARGENRTRILVVDDDPQTLRYVRDALSSAGYACTVTGDPEQVGILLEREKPHLVLLDLLLPGTDGIGLMERLPMLSRVPVIFLSAYGRDQIIAQALEAGADDYIVKPFSPTELVARIRTVLRRRAVPATAEPAEPFVSGELTIDYGERRVSLSGRSIPLTDKEYRLLYELSVNAGRVVPHDHLLQALWGPGHPGHPGPVRTVVKNLRKKLADGAESPSYIFNEPRVGYRMPRAGTAV